jgi:hypothetical protein
MPCKEPSHLEGLGPKPCTTHVLELAFSESGEPARSRYPTSDFQSNQLEGHSDRERKVPQSSTGLGDGSLDALYSYRNSFVSDDWLRDRK